MTEQAPFDSLLSEIIDNRGRTCPIADAGKPLIATNCVKNGALYPTFEKVRYVSEETYRGWFRGHPEPGDLIFVTKGAPGQVCLAPDPVPFCIAQDMVAVRADPNRVYPAYLLAALRSSTVQASISNMHVGSLIPHFKKGDFDKLLIPLPDPTTQRCVGDFYLLLSRKIDLNRRMNETLESMARAVFKDWFVDFGPTRAKVEGRKPYLSPELWDLFPNSLDNEGIPLSWTRQQLIELCQLKRGYDLPTGLRKEGQYPIVSSSGVSGYHAAAMATAPGIVTGRYGTIGQVFFVGTDFWPLNTALYVKDLKGSSPRFVFYTLCGLDFQQFSDKGAVPGVNRNDLHQWPVVIPPVHVQSAFEALLSSVWKRAALNEDEASILAHTRDLLLPKLMSGELRVRDAERAIEEIL